MSVEDKEREFYYQTIQLLMQQNRELITLIIDLAGKQMPPIPPGFGVGAIDVNDMMSKMFKQDSRFSPSVDNDKLT